MIKEALLEIAFLAFVVSLPVLWIKLLDFTRRWPLW